MSKVYFIKNSELDNKKISKDALELLKKVVSDVNFHFEKEIPIKVHFGEKGNKTFTSPECYSDIINYLKESGVSPCFIETNVLYRGSRTTTEQHLETAKSHGFTEAPIVIADGEIGTDYNEIEINKKYFKKCKIGKEYDNYSQFIVMSHFKGHIAAGFGGAIKQLSMGFAARGGKLELHTDIAPIVSASGCIACGLCMEKCNYDAIKINNIAVIDADKCIGCAGCIAVCPEAAISNSWSGTNFLEKLSEYAFAATKGKEIIYLSFLNNVTQECDCMGITMRPITTNIGILAGTDPVALDTASLDLLQKYSGKRHFENGRQTLKYGQEIGLGSMNYELEEIIL